MRRGKVSWAIQVKSISKTKKKIAFSWTDCNNVDPPDLSEKNCSSWAGIYVKGTVNIVTQRELSAVVIETNVHAWIYGIKFALFFVRGIFVSAIEKKMHEYANVHENG